MLLIIRFGNIKVLSSTPKAISINGADSGGFPGGKFGVKINRFPLLATKCYRLTSLSSNRTCICCELFSSLFPPREYNFCRVEVEFQIWMRGGFSHPAVFKKNKKKKTEFGVTFFKMSTQNLFKWLLSSINLIKMTRFDLRKFL